MAMDPNVTPECELEYENNGPGLDGLKRKCSKYKSHDSFIPAKDFGMKHLPSECQTEEIMEFIKRMCDRTVKVSVSHTSQNRPNTYPYPDSDKPYPFSHLKGNSRVVRTGTGIIRYVVHEHIPADRDKTCPCRECRKSIEPKKQFWNVVVITSTHVVFDDDEAANSTIECYYDSEDKAGVGRLYGIRLRDNRSTTDLTDRCSVTCVTHDANLVGKLTELQRGFRGMYDISLRGLTFGIIISHPHGGIKKISLGNVLHLCLYITKTFPRDEPHRFGQNLEYQLLSDSNNCSPESPDAATVKLPYGTTFTLPTNAPYLCKARKSKVHFWMTYPPGTVFSSPKGENLNLDPEATEFYCDKMDYYMKHEGMYYLTYDIPTCPGSSGAEIFHYDEIHTRSFLSHAGSEDNHNRSSLNVCLR